MAGAGGFEPTNAGVKVPCLTAWLRPSGMQETVYQIKLSVVNSLGPG